jgi:hypothetical protein
MPDDAVPILVGSAEYFLRFGQDDLIAAENDVKMGYVYFLDPKYASLTLYRSLIHRGLKVKNRATGDLEQAYPSGDDGVKLAGEWVRLYLTNGGTLPDLMVAVRKALDAWPWYKPGKPEESKNSPGDGL